MYCTNCGSEIVEGDRFCRNCGNPTETGLTSGNARQPSRPIVPLVEDEITLMERMTDVQRRVYTLRRKDGTVAVLLALFLGGLGGQFFYLGNTVAGVLCVLFFWTFVPAIIGLVDACLVSGRVRAHNERLAREIISGHAPL